MTTNFEVDVSLSKMVKKSKTLVVWSFLLSPMLILVMSCNEEGDLWMVYKETQCADPWQNLNEPGTKEKVIAYLADLGVEVHKIEIERYSYGPFCEACNCPSGNDIKVWVSREDKGLLLARDFE